MTIYEKIFKALNDAQVKYLVVGGVAVNLYGYSRFTGDIDILSALDEVNLKKMDEAMKNLNYNPRLPVEIHELSDTKKVKTWMEEKNLKAYTFNSGKEPYVDIDIIIEESFEFEKLGKRKSEMRAWDTTLPVISIDDLIGMKKKANRDKDLIDLKALIELKSL
jgi:hypothetical protein